MPRDTAQPFNDSTQRRTDDRSLVKEVLGSGSADEMFELVGDQGEVQALPEGDDFGEIEVTADEAEAQKQAEVTPEERRAQYIEWTEGNEYIDEETIDEIFEFLPNGSVVGKCELDVFEDEEVELPEGLVEIKGGLNLKWADVKNFKNVPKIIRGDLNLYEATVDSFDVFPDLVEGDVVLAGSNVDSLAPLAGSKITGDLWIDSLGVDSIPSGIDVGGKVNIDENQVDLLEDARRKGYDVVKLSVNHGHYEGDVAQ